MSQGRVVAYLDNRSYKTLETRLRLLEQQVLGHANGVTADWDGPAVELRKISALTVLKRHVVDFWNNISLPGFKYVGEPGRHRSDRYIWIIVLMLSLMVSSEYIADAYKKWQGSPVLLSFNDSLTPIALIPFPAVSFCPARRLSTAFDSTNTEFLQNLSNTHFAASLLCPKSSNFNTSEFNERYYNSTLDDFIEEVSISCEEVLEWFKFSKDDYVIVKQNHSECIRYFQTLYTEGGSVCFTFNMLSAKNLFKPDVIPPMVDKTELPLKSRWSPDAMLEKADLEKTIPRYIDTNGRWSGLFLGLSNFTARDFGLCGNSTSSAKMFFHHPAEMPMYQTHETIEVPLHEQLYLRVTPEVVTASQELQAYTPVNRRCYFSHEKQLSLFKVYTQRNCQLECRVNCSLSLCDCVPFYLPKMFKKVFQLFYTILHGKAISPVSVINNADNTDFESAGLNSSIRICGKDYRTSCSFYLITGILEGRITWRDILWQFRNDTGHRIQERFEGFESKYNKEGYKLTDKLLNETYPECACDCPAACTSLLYHVKVEEGEPLDSTLLSQDFTRLSVSFKELEFTSVLRKELIGLTDFIANSGGVLGVFTGFSFLALCELVYYLTLRLWSTVKHAWDQVNISSSTSASRGRGDRLRCCFNCGPVVATD